MSSQLVVAHTRTWGGPATRTAGAAPLRVAGSAVLPRWPLLAALYGLPAYWALGLLPFVYMGLAALMLGLLVVKARWTFLKGTGPYYAFLVWVAVSAVTISGAGQMIGYAWRMGDLVAVGVFLLYYANAPRLTPGDLIWALTYVWVVLIIFGLAAMAFPHVRLQTPTAAILPGAIAGNPLVTELVNPRLAEVQEPWGAAQPYVRPAAPFPYTNSWGTAYVLLTPVAIGAVILARRWRTRWVLLALLVVSLVPAVATSNRGMFLGLATAVVYATVRFMLQGRVLPMVVLGLGSLIAALALIWSGAVAEILGRQQYSNSTGTRSTVYETTFRKTMESPLVGWGSPQEVPGVEVALGTQGYVWTLMFSYGFVGLGLFLLFLWGTVLRTRRVVTVPEVLLHGVLVSTCVMVLFYGLGSTQLLIVALVSAVLLDRRSLTGTRG